MDEFINCTVGDYLDKAAIKFADNEAVVYVDRDIRMTYKEFNDNCRKVSKGLIALGIKNGDNVAVWAPNYPEWLALIFATAKIGAVLVTVNTEYKKFELEYLLTQSDSKALFMGSGFKGSNYIEIVKELIPEIKNGSLNIQSDIFPLLNNIIFMPRLKGNSKGEYEDTPENYTSFNEIIKLGESITDEALDLLQNEVKPDDVTNIQYTSGTTGFPKGVMLTHINILNNAKDTGDIMALDEKDRFCISVPFFHCIALTTAILSSVTHGSTMVPIDSFSPVKVFEVVEKEKCTALNGAPAMFKIMLDHPDFEKYDLTSLRTGIIAGAVCPEQLVAKVMKYMKDLVIGYGQTETSPCNTMTTLGDTYKVRTATVGKPIKGVEAKIIDPNTGDEVPNNTRGEFCSRGYNTMKGYYKNPERTADTIDSDGFNHSGDLALCDDEGNYVVFGRINDTIIRGGENLDPIEIERLLNTHPDILEAWVVGVPSEIYGEEIAACIKKHADSKLTEQEVKDFASANISRTKVPFYVDFFEKFPSTASGKVQKYKLREIMAEVTVGSPA